MVVSCVTAIVGEGSTGGPGWKNTSAGLLSKFGNILTNQPSVVNTRTLYNVPDSLYVTYPSPIIDLCSVAFTLAVESGVTPAVPELFINGSRFTRLCVCPSSTSSRVLLSMKVWNAILLLKSLAPSD